MKFVFLLLSLPIALGSYCGQSAVPFTFQVLRSGFPVLGCARPKCFGWTVNGTRAGDTAQFYRVGGKEDGYLRKADQFSRPPSNNANFVPKTAVCTPSYKPTGCNANEWVGGIAPQGNAFSGLPIQLRCCSYEPLSQSVDRGLAIVRQGQLVVGGEVMENGQLVAFDYIANVNKETQANGTVVYYATIKRMSCFDDSAPAASNPQNLFNPGNALPNAQTQPTQQQVFAQPAAPQVQPQQLQQQQFPQQQQQQQQQNFQFLQQPTQQTQQFGVPVANMPFGLPTGQQLQYQPQLFGQTPGYGNNVYGQLQQQNYGLSGVQDGRFGSAQQQQQALQPQAFPTAFPNLMPNLLQPQQNYAGQQYSLPQAPTMNFQMPSMQQQPQAMNMQIPAMPIMQPQPQQYSAAAAPPMAIASSTFPPITMPKFEDLPKLQIPSVEDVEQVIPPVQRAILTSVAKFFGVL